jgi:hypothetical protein
MFNRINFLLSAFDLEYINEETLERLLFRHIVDNICSMPCEGWNP